MSDAVIAIEATDLAIAPREFWDAVKAWQTETGRLVDPSADEEPAARLTEKLKKLVRDYSAAGGLDMRKPRLLGRGYWLSG